MYESFFGLREKPFSLLPDPGFLFMSRQHQQALTLLEYGIMNQAGFIVLTGEIGSGKTTLMRHLLNRLDPRFNVGLISNTHQSLGELMDWVCMAFDLPAAGMQNKLEKYQAFIDFLVNTYGRGNRVLLVVDEAQNLGVEKLEELRLLSNINAGKDLVLQMMLLGQPQLRELLRDPNLEQFAQRVTASYHIGPLDPTETESYIRHRIFVAGGTREIFTREACVAVHHYSRGVPRLINLICDTALVYAYGADQRILDGAAIDEFVASHTPNLMVSVDLEREGQREAPSDLAERRGEAQVEPQPSPVDLRPASATPEPTKSPRIEAVARDDGSEQPANEAPIQKRSAAHEPATSPTRAPTVVVEVTASERPETPFSDAEPLHARRDPVIERSTFPSEDEPAPTQPASPPHPDTAPQIPEPRTHQKPAWLPQPPQPDIGEATEAAPSGIAADRDAPAGLTPAARRRPSFAQTRPVPPHRYDRKRSSIPWFAILGVTFALGVGAIWALTSRTEDGTLETRLAAMTQWLNRATPAPRPDTQQAAPTPGTVDDTPADTQPPGAAADSDATRAASASPSMTSSPPLREPDRAPTAAAPPAAPTDGGPATTDPGVIASPVPAQDQTDAQPTGVTRQVSSLLGMLSGKPPDNAPAPAGAQPEPTQSTAQRERAATGSTPASPPVLSAIHSQLRDLAYQVQQSDSRSVTADLGPLVQFDDGSATLNRTARDTLAGIAAVLKDYPAVQVRIIAHTDSSGSESANRLLSSRRAASVATYLESLNISPERVEYEGRGKSELRADTEQERRLGTWINRRIELELTESGSGET
jgi:type II secretory pathway predicted ATPase ExeA/outer membrane protein OmpA-like peptidoglycan-associated protein